MAKKDDQFIISYKDCNFFWRKSRMSCLGDKLFTVIP